MAVTRLVCAGISRTYGTAFTLGPISFELSVGVTCLVGPNGAGKSTFFRLAAGVERPSSGSINLYAQDVRPKLGYLPQAPLLPMGATCEQFLHYVAWLQRVPRPYRQAAVQAALASVGLTERRGSKIRSLSGGMQRRLGIAHTMVHGPDLLLLDEPTSGLDPRQRVGLRETITTLASDRIVVVATHLVEDIRGLADRVIVLNHGQVMYDGDVSSLEEKADPAAPGDSDLERAVATLIEEEV